MYILIEKDQIDNISIDSYSVWNRNGSIYFLHLFVKLIWYTNGMKYFCFLRISSYVLAKSDVQGAYLYNICF